MTMLLQCMLALQRAPRLSVLGYHRVMAEHDPLRPGEPTAAEFEARMRWVAANFDVLALPEAVRALREHRLPRRALSITFDDGYADNHALAVPILKRLQLPATFFVATGYLDGGCMFNDVVIEAVRVAPGPALDLQDLGFGADRIASNEERLQAIDRILQRLRYRHPAQRDQVARAIAERTGAKESPNLMMSSAQVAGLLHAGMTLGAHTITHPILAETDLARAREEISGSRERLEQIVGTPVRLFAYPNGKPGRDYRPEHVALVRELGFDAAITTVWGAARPGDDLFQIPRFTPWDRANWRFGLRLAKSRFPRPYAFA